MTRPEKPYPDFPLFPHPVGQWAKKIKGKTRYFGSWAAGWQAASATYEQEREALYAGRTPTAPGDGITLRYLCDHFLTRKEDAANAGRITHRLFAEYKATAMLVRDTIGPNRTVPTLEAGDFTELLGVMSKRFGPVRLKVDITRVKAIFRHGMECGLIDKQIVYGPDFRPPTSRLIRLAMAGTVRTFTAGEVCKLLKGSTGQIHAMILLGINCGLGNREVGELCWRHLDLRGGWIDYPRNKSGIARRSKLWPVTVQSLKAIQISRDGTNPNDQVFVTLQGNSWASDTHRPLSLEFRKLLDRTKTRLERRGFNALRHTYRTIAGGCCDKEAVDYTMGHRPDHISTVYTHSIDDKRLQKAADHVRRWMQKHCKQV